MEDDDDANDDDNDDANDDDNDGANDDAPEYTAYCQAAPWTATSIADKHSPLVDISADVFGTSCVSPNAHATGSSYKYLHTVSKGCNSFGSDSYAR